MDPERIQKLTEDVLSQLGGTTPSAEGGDLESRVAALERAVFAPSAGSEAPRSSESVTLATATQIVTHPSHHFLRVVGGTLGEPCVLEPDKPCTHSRRCQALGY